MGHDIRFKEREGHLKENDAAPLEDEVTAKNNPDNRELRQTNNDEIDILEDEGEILKKLFD